MATCTLRPALIRRRSPRSQVLYLQTFTDVLRTPFAARPPRYAARAAVYRQRIHCMRVNDWNVHLCGQAGPEVNADRAAENGAEDAARLPAAWNRQRREAARATTLRRLPRP